MQQAKVTLRQAQIDRLVSGDTVSIRLKDTTLEIRFDSLAKIHGNSDNYGNDHFADFMSRLGRR